MSELNGSLHAHDAVHWYVSDLSSRVVAESGIAGDFYHLGKIVLRSLKDAPDFIMQIDGATGQSETNRSAMERSIRCAHSLKRAGLQKGDVMILMAPNHLDLAIPLYAALFLGIIVAPIDTSLGVVELEHFFNSYNAKVIFCQDNKVSDIKQALNNNKLVAKIVTFDKGVHDCRFSEFMEIHPEDDIDVENFRVIDFDPAETTAFLMSTSGSTGLPKGAACSHKNFRISVPYIWLDFDEFPSPTKMAMVVSPLQWISAVFHFLWSPILRYIRLQSSKPTSVEHVIDLVNTYKPTVGMGPSNLFRDMITRGCDISSFKTLMVGGSPVPIEFVDIVKNVSPNTKTKVCYGSTEICGFCFENRHLVRGSVGNLVGGFSYRLIDLDTLTDIRAPNVSGELWLKGPTIFKGYYKNPEATAEAIVEGGWFRTGDIFYRDEHWNFYFVERLKLLLKYKSYQVSPTELELVIRKHPSVKDVAVTGIPDSECGDLPVACIVITPGTTVNAQEIKDLVKDSLADSKQLRGGVIFMEQIPTTASGKINRKKLKEWALKMHRE